MSMTTETSSARGVHTCSYACERPECIRAQRDELATRLTAAPPPAAARGDVRGLVADRAAINLLVAAGFVTEAKANEALNIAHGFAPGPLAAEGVQAGGVECDCPGEGKDDPALHAPNCPARLSQQTEARGVVDEDEVFRLAAGSHYGAEPNSYWDMDREALLAFARALTGERNG